MDTDREEESKDATVLAERTPAGGGGPLPAEGRSESAPSPVTAPPSAAAPAPAEDTAETSRRLRLVPPDGKPPPWLSRHRGKLYALEWTATVAFALLALYYLWLLLFSVSSPGPGATRPPSREEFRERLRALAPIKPDPAWKVAAKPGRWRGIVIHHTATDGGSPEAIDRYHREKMKFENGLGYHFLIGNGKGMGNGEVAVSQRWSEQEKLDGAHVKKMSDEAMAKVFGAPPGSRANSFTIGVSLVGNFENSLATPEQLASLRGLLTFLRKEYGIGLAAIVGHGAVSADPTACPGQWFFVDEMILALANP